MNPKYLFNNSPQFAATGVKTKNPHKPIIPLGIAAKTSITMTNTLDITFGAKNTINNAKNTEIGTAITKAIIALKNVP